MRKYKVQSRFYEAGVIYNIGDVIKLEKERAEALGDFVKIKDTIEVKKIDKAPEDKMIKIEKIKIK
jgi:hypothetical protein